MTQTILIDNINSFNDFSEMFRIHSGNPFFVAGLAMFAFAQYMKDTDAGIQMINCLKGPSPLSEYEIQFLQDRKKSGYDYVPISFFNGATPSNNYTPVTPLEINVSDNVYSYINEGYARLLVKSSGADNLRFIVLRQKASTGEWFLWE